MVRAILFGLALSCTALVFAQKVEKEGREWLDAFTDPVEVNANGAWNGGEWKTVTLVQSEGGRDITGNGDGWQITGVVSGKRLFLLFHSRGKVVYCAELAQEDDGSFTGSYTKGMPTEKSKGRPMRLTR